MKDITVDSEWRNNFRKRSPLYTDTISRFSEYYRPPDQEEEVDKAFYKQLQAASQSQALVLMGDFNHPDIS